MSIVIYTKQCADKSISSVTVKKNLLTMNNFYNLWETSLLRAINYPFVYFRKIFNPVFHSGKVYVYDTFLISMFHVFC